MSRQPAPIAIVGMGCRFPGANNPQEFWQLLCNGVDAITNVSSVRNGETFQADKIDTQFFGGFIEQIDQFDNDFFDISPREAISIDPQHRLLLEVGWEALEHAGLSSAQLEGTQGGVFVGISNGDYYYLKENLRTVDAYLNVGNAFCIAANRLSYFLDWHGPSWAVDAACSSSLVAVHQACQSLRLGECNLALAAGVNLILHSKPTRSFAQAQMLAPDSRCKAFDASADGYVRGEGVGVVVLKLLSDAIAERDTIYAVIRGSAVNQDGLSNGLMAPNPAAQAAVVKAAYQQAQVSPAQIQYVEAHGTGTKLGDSIEIHALSRILSEGRAADNICTVGSVKTNIGHLEAASGIAGLIKVILSMQHQQIPASLHFQTPNPYVRFDAIPLRVQQMLMPWPQNEHLALAGIHSFGFGGTNAHIVLEGVLPTNTSSANPQKTLERPLHILTLSGKTKQALLDLTVLYQAHLETYADTELTNICYTANAGRTHFNHRLSMLAVNRQDLRTKLAMYQTLEQTVAGCFLGDLPEDIRTPTIAFVFTKPESQVLDMGRQLYQTQSTFRRTLEHCADIVSSYLERSLVEVLYPSSKFNLQSSTPDQPIYIQPALFAIEYALYQLWQSWGVRPTALMGENIGAFVAACIAGVFSLEDGLKLVAMLGKMIHHSPPMASILNDVEQVVQQVRYSPPKIKLISPITGQILSKDIATADYWYQQCLDLVNISPVNITARVRHPQQEKIEIFLECGPQSSLLERFWQCDDTKKIWLSSLSSCQDDWQQILSSLSELYVHGVNIDWIGFEQDYPQRRKVSLPTYPFQRKRHWIDSPQHQDLSDQAVHLCDRSLLQQVRSAPLEERSMMLMRHLQKELQQILRLMQLPEPDVSFLDLGLDSLMAVELLNRLQHHLGHAYTVPNDLLLNYPNSYQLATYLSRQLNPLPEVKSQAGGEKSRIKTSHLDGINTSITNSSRIFSPSNNISLLSKTQPHKETPRPLHSAQLFFWLQLIPMNTGMRFGVHDEISTDSLLQACNKLIERYDTLTTAIDTEFPKTTGQHYSQTLRIPIVQHSFSFTDQKAKEQFWVFYRRIFDRHHGPLIRFEIHQGTPSGQELWIAIDHIAFDGHSASILFEDLNALLMAEQLPEPQRYYDLSLQEVHPQDATFWYQYLNSSPLLVIPKSLLSQQPGKVCQAISRKLVDQLHEQYRTIEEFEQIIIAATVSAISQVTKQSAFTVCITNKACQRTHITNRVFGPLIQVNFLVFRDIPTRFKALLSLVEQETARIKSHRDTPDIIKYWQFQRGVFGHSINWLVSIISILLGLPKKFSDVNSPLLTEAMAQLWVGKLIRRYLNILPGQMKNQSGQKTLVSINMFPTFITSTSSNKKQNLEPLLRYNYPETFTYVSCRLEGEGNGHTSPVIIIQGAGLGRQTCQNIASYMAATLEQLRE